MYSDELLAPWLAVLRDRLPPLDLVDMHVHVGLSDPAGLLASEEGALASLALASACSGDRTVARSCSWPSTAAPPARTARTATCCGRCAGC